MTDNINKSSLQYFQEFFEQETLNQLPGTKFHVVMLFYRETELGISNDYNKWINTANRYFKNGSQALNFYANTKCPASQLISADTIEDLIKQMKQMQNNYNNNTWLNNNLYPYL